MHSESCIKIEQRGGKLLKKTVTAGRVMLRPRKGGGGSSSLRDNVTT